MFETTEKTGFLVKSLPVIILDDNGKIFYDSSKVEKKIRAFNLPRGKYELAKGKIQKLNKPVSYPFYPMPKRERFRKLPNDFKIVFGTNPNKCSILWNEKTILFDESMKNLTKPQIYFILFHEFGHHKYKTEKYCDLFAANMMLKHGFNPSQIGLSSIHSLSDSNFERKEYLVNKIIGNE